MYNHVDENYVCPICVGIDDKYSGETLIVPDDVVFRDEIVTAFISSYFIGNNPGHVVVVPNEHFENLYDMPESVGASLFALTKRVAHAIRSTYGCLGITTLQNNEPVGDQHAFHFHQHVFPRFESDGLHLNMTTKRHATAIERLAYANRLRSSGLLN